MKAKTPTTNCKVRQTLSNNFHLKRKMNFVSFFSDRISQSQLVCHGSQNDLINESVCISNLQKN